jgi:hypothetical protein
MTSMTIEGPTLQERGPGRAHGVTRQPRCEEYAELMKLMKAARARL